MQGRFSRWPSGSRVELGAVALVLALGAYLRLAELEVGQFLYDDISLWNIVRDLAGQPHLLASGMHSSFGLENGPFQAYLLLPGLLTAPSPLGAYYTVALLNVLGIVLFWAFVRNYWGAKTAFLAALLYSVNPWAVVFSRRLWGNDMLAPFTVLLVWSLCDLVRHGRRRDSILPLLWLAIVIQVYVVALVHLLSAALGLGLGLRRLRLPYFIVGLALFAALVTPYFLNTVLPALSALARLFGLSETYPVVDSTSAVFTLQLVSSEGYQAFANHAGVRLDAASGLPYAVSLLAEALLVVGLGAAISEAVSACRRRALARAVPYVLIIAVTLLPALLLVRHTSPVYPWYLLSGFPMPFLLVALGLRLLWRGLNRVAARCGGAFSLVPKYALATAVTIVIATHLVLSQAFFGAIHDYSPDTAYGMPLRYTLDIAETTRKLAQELGSTKVYIGGPTRRDANLYLAMRRDLPDISPFDSTNTFIRPAAGKALYVLSSTDDRVGQAFAERLSNVRVASFQVPGPAPGLRYSFFSATAGDLEDLFSHRLSTPVDVTFDGRARLDSYGVESELQPGQPSQLILHWTLLEGPSSGAPTYYAYVRLMDQSREVGHGEAFPFYAEGRRQAGEQIMMWRALPTPAALEPGVYSYLLGLYSLTPTSYRNAPAVGADGHLLGDGVRLGTLVVRRAVPANPAHALAVGFGPQVALEGYDLAGSGFAPGESLDIALYWKALAKVERDYTVFVHLLGADGKIVAQDDSRPASGRYPSTVWLPGDTIVDRHTLRLPGSLTSGQYTVAVGLYHLATGERLGGASFAAAIPVMVK